MGSADLLNGGWDIDRAPEGQIEIVLGLNRSSVDGRVVNERLEPIAWQNPDFVRAYEDRGTPIRAGDGGTFSVEAPAIRR